MNKISVFVLQALFTYYNAGTVQRVHYALDRKPPRTSQMLNQRAQFYEYALLDGRRIVPASRTRRKHAGSSLVKVIWNGKMCVGIVDNIFRHTQRSFEDDQLWAEMRWMKLRDESPVVDDPWHD
jgi:hypothetical protein